MSVSHDEILELARRVEKWNISVDHTGYREFSGKFGRMLPFSNRVDIKAEMIPQTRIQENGERRIEERYTASVRVNWIYNALLYGDSAKAVYEIAREASKDRLSPLEKALVDGQSKAREEFFRVFGGGK